MHERQRLAQARKRAENTPEFARAQLVYQRRYVQKRSGSAVLDPLPPPGAPPNIDRATVSKWRYNVTVDGVRHRGPARLTQDEALADLASAKAGAAPVSPGPTCKKCGQRGHYAKTCGRQPSDRQQRAAISRATRAGWAGEPAPLPAQVCEVCFGAHRTGKCPYR